MAREKKVMKRALYFLMLACGLAAIVLFGPPRVLVNANQDSKPAEIKIDPKVFDEVVGQYALDNNPDIVFSFFREADKYYLQVTNQGRIEIFPAAESKFFLKILDADATFVRDEQGKIVRMLWRQDTSNLTAKKINSVPAVQASTPFERKEE